MNADASSIDYKTFAQSSDFTVKALHDVNHDSKHDVMHMHFIIEEKSLNWATIYLVTLFVLL